MQRLLDFLHRSRFFLLFLLLQSIGFVMVVSQYDYHRSLMAGITGRAGFFVMEKMSGWRHYFFLGQENKRLAQENARLRSLLTGDDKREESTDSPETAADNPYGFIAATVVSNSFLSPKNYVVLDRGTVDGVALDDGVVTDKGVLGVIVQVSKHYSVCRSLLHTGSYISARFKKNDYFGTIQWDGQDRRYVHLLNVPRQAEVSVGDTIVTDRRSTLFPQGLFIGTVETVEADSQNDAHRIKVRLADDFAALHQVYILQYRNREELKQALDYE